MKTEIKITIVCLFAFFNFLNTRTCFGVEAEKGADKNDSGPAFEQALKNYESYRKKEESEVAIKIHSELEKVAKDWIAQAGKNQEKLLGTRIEQNWEKLALIFPISPVYYEYNLRGYKYSVIKKDVSKSESITSPYKATASIREELYVERNHSEDISNPVPYFFTVTTVYNLNFEYKQNKIELINSDNKIVNIQNSVPDTLTKWSV